MVGYFFVIVGFYKFRFCKCFIPIIMRAINKQDMCLLISKVVIFKKNVFNNMQLSVTQNKIFTFSQ